jgi:hypothetical protein
MAVVRELTWKFFSRHPLMAVVILAMRTTPDFPPLRYPEGWPQCPSLLERIGLWIPVVGWIVSNQLEKRRLIPGESAILDQLAARPDIPGNVWRDNDQADIANRIIECVTSECEWPHPRFAPNDPFEILIQWRTGDLCEVAALMNIEREFGMSLDDKTIDRVVRMTFGEVVDFIAASSRKVAK